LGIDSAFFKFKVIINCIANGAKHIFESLDASTAKGMQRAAQLWGRWIDFFKFNSSKPSSQGDSGMTPGTGENEAVACSLAPRDTSHINIGSNTGELHKGALDELGKEPVKDKNLSRRK
jgi:hypothetical protein